MSSEQSISFAQYGKVFQEKIVQACLSDNRWAEQMSEVLDVRYFDLKYLQYLADKFFEYAKKYKTFPTFELLITIIRDDLKSNADTLLRDQIVEFLQRVKSNPNPGDLKYVQDKSLDFCRKQSLKIALEKCVDLMETEKYESCVDVVKNAVSVGTTPSMGHDFFEDIDARFTNIVRNCIPTGIEQLDKKGVLCGGLGRGELGGFNSSTWGGKCV